MALAAVGQDPVAQMIAVVLPDGTEFTVVTTEEITSKTATEGNLLTFKVAENVVIDGHVVIAKDALVKGEVSTAKKSGFFGRGGNLGIRIESTMTVDNQKNKLRSGKRQSRRRQDRNHRRPGRPLRTPGIFEEGKASHYQTGNRY